MFPLYWRFHDNRQNATTQLIFPVAGWHHHDGASGGFVGPFFGWSSKNSDGWGAGIAPVLFFGRNGTRRHALVLPIFALRVRRQRRHHHDRRRPALLHTTPDGGDGGLFPLVFAGKHKHDRLHVHPRPLLPQGQRRRHANVVGPVFVGGGRTLGGRPVPALLGRWRSRRRPGPLAPGDPAAAARALPQRPGAHRSAADGSHLPSPRRGRSRQRALPAVLPAPVADQRLRPVAHRRPRAAPTASARPWSARSCAAPTRRALVDDRCSSRSSPCTTRPTTTSASSSRSSGASTTATRPTPPSSRSTSAAARRRAAGTASSRCSSTRTPASPTRRSSARSGRARVPTAARAAASSRCSRFDSKVGAGGKRSSWFGMPGVYADNNQFTGKSNAVGAALLSRPSRPDGYQAGVIPLVFAWRNGTDDARPGAALLPLERPDQGRPARLLPVGYYGHEGKSAPLGSIPLVLESTHEDGSFRRRRLPALLPRARTPTARRW